MMYHCRVISVINVALWWGLLILGEVMHVWGQDNYEKSLYLPVNFAVNVKLLLFIVTKTCNEVLKIFYSYF